MTVQAPFGFVTGCHAGDKFMVQATPASMRHYCPEVPICLVVDGNFDVSDLAKEYDLIVLRVCELPSSLTISTMPSSRTRTGTFICTSSRNMHSRQKLLAFGSRILTIRITTRFRPRSGGFRVRSSTNLRSV